MSYTNGLDKPTDYFRIKTYTGNATNDTAITWDETDNMKPDWLWFKNRSQTQSHALFDSTRGATLRLISNSTGAEGTENTNLDSFDTNGFTVDYEAIVNGSGDNMVAWGWKANGGTTSSNTDGSITSTVQADTTAGFSIVSYTGTQTTATVGHGLGVAPACIIFKNRDINTHDWFVYHQSIGNMNALFLNTTSATSSSASFFGGTTPTSTQFTVGGEFGVNKLNTNIIAYCFAEKKGFSKMGSYVGVASSDSNFVFLGFKPSFLLIKNTSTSGTNWHMYDNKRLGYNVDNNMLRANLNNASQTDDDIDLLSNGFKLRRSTSALNNSGDTFIYYAVAESPFTTSTGIPTTAR